jgi:Domain of unknown function (DUF4234)
MTFALTAMTYAMAAHNATGAGKHRSPWAIAGLNLITLGLYSVYWWYVTNRELRDFGRNHDVAELEKEPALSALAFLFGSCLVVPLVWTAVATARRIRLAQEIVGATKLVHVGVPVALLSASMLIRLGGGGGTGVLVALIAVALALKSAAIAYMQVSLNELWALDSDAPEPPPATEELDPPLAVQV